MNKDGQAPKRERIPQDEQVLDTEKTHADDGGSHTIPISRREVFGEIVVKHSAYLQITGLPGGQKNVELGQDSTEIGRTTASNLQLDLPGVSRNHAKIAFSNDEYHLDDLDSTNGTFVNGVRVSRCVLRNNDVIQIGEAKMRFVEERTRQILDPLT